VIAPSNPIVSIGPVLSVPGIAKALEDRRAHVVAVSPIIGGRALKGPADRLLVELGDEPSALGVARRLSPFIGSMVIDNQDVGLRGEIAALGLNVAVTDTIMRDPTVSAKLADVVILTGIGATGE
jgi:LPPG:FO 2-phospho-L-lactate transferase